MRRLVLASLLLPFVAAAAPPPGGAPDPLAPPRAAAQIEAPPVTGALQPWSSPIEAWVRPADARAVDTLTLPDLRTPCATAADARAASVEQAGLGDEAMLIPDMTRAFGHWRVAIVIDGCNAEAWASLGVGLVGTGQIDAGVVALQTATRLAPHNPRLWTELGRTHERQQAWPQAIAAYQSALMLRDADMVAAAGLARAGRSGR